MLEDTQEELNRLESQSTRTLQTYGIFGQINLVTSPYLIMIAEAALIGQIFQTNSEVLRVEKLLYIPLRG